MQTRSFVVALVTLAACGDDGAAVDGGPNDQMIVVDIDNGSCGDTIRLTGEYVDWDTDASFCGINEAELEVNGGGQIDSTAPNGRFDLCTPDQDGTRLNITQPTANSQCTASPAPYTIPTILYIRRNVILAGGFYSARSWTTDRQFSIFALSNTTFDARKAQVHVHVDGTATHAVSLAAPHEVTQAIVGTAWVLGDTGADVFFPNVDVGTGQTALSVAGGAVGTGMIPLVAGTLTNVTVYAP